MIKCVDGSGGLGPAKRVADCKGNEAMAIMDSVGQRCAARKSGGNGGGVGASGAVCGNLVDERCFVAAYFSGFDTENICQMGIIALKMTAFDEEGHVELVAQCGGGAFEMGKGVEFLVEESGRFVEIGCDE